MRTKACLAIVMAIFMAGCASTHPGIHAIPQPVATSLQVQSTEGFTVTIAQDESLSLGESSVPLEDLTRRLSELGGDGSQTVTITAHREVPHKAVIAVLDALAKAGYARVSFATTSE